MSSLWVVPPATDCTGLLTTEDPALIFVVRPLKILVNNDLGLSVLALGVEEFVIPRPVNNAPC